MSGERLFFVPGGLEGERVDVALSRLLGLSRTKVADLVQSGNVLIDGEVPARSERVSEGQELAVTLPEVRDIADVAPEKVDGMDIVFEDADIVVVNKPVGVAAHPSVGWEGPTVLGGLLGAGVAITTSGAQERRGIVSRLDVGTIDAPIGRSQKHDYKFAVMASGKPSVTHYDVIEMFPGASLLDIKLETGRTHQIRVHMSAAGHPLAGDPQYGSDPKLAEKLGLVRQWLHARALAFEHPTRHSRVTFEAPYPTDLEHALEVLRSS